MTRTTSTWQRIYGETRNATPITNKFTNISGFANKTQDVLLVAQYQFDFGLCLVHRLHQI
ncbi:porin [Escherichia coli]